jgi:hypothetical protein
VTLLEAAVALAILGLSAVGYLQIFQGTARGLSAAEEWSRAAAYAEATLEHSIQARLADRDEPALEVAGQTAHVETRQWRGRVDVVVVTVSLHDGRTLTLHRLVRRR